MKITEAILDVRTGEQTITERDATPAEIKEIEKARAQAAAKEIEIVAQEAARQALLDKLGITAEEAKLLLS